MNESNSRILKVEKSSAKNFKWKARCLKLSQRHWKGKAPQKQLINDFDDVANETGQNKEEVFGVGWDTEKLGQAKKPYLRLIGARSSFVRRKVYQRIGLEGQEVEWTWSTT